MWEVKVCLHALLEVVKAKIQFYYFPDGHVSQSWPMKQFCCASVASLMPDPSA